MAISTADLCDAGDDAVQVLQLHLFDYGGAPDFAGVISTVLAPEDNTQVRAALESPGDGRVLVVDGAGSRRCALLGDNIGELARDNGWAGVVVNGCVRDSTALAKLPVGIKALGTCPRKSNKAGHGTRDVPVTFGGVLFVPGHYLYVDADGVLVAPRALQSG